MTIPPPSRATLGAASLAVLPYLAVILADIFGHPGSYIHFSRGEALLLVLILALLQWVTCVVVLAVSIALARGAAWLLIVSAVSAFAAIAGFIEPRFWHHLLDPGNGGRSEWLFRTGVLAVLLVLLFGYGSHR